MDRFIMQHQEHVVGTLSCFDRVIFKGHLPIGHARGLDRFLTQIGLKLCELKDFAVKVSGRLKAHAQQVAESAGREYRYLNSIVRKEDLARQLADRDGIGRGLVCVLAAVEPCQSFRMMYGEGRPFLRVETVINDPRELKVRRVTRDKGVTNARWSPMPKGVAYLDRTERIAAAANNRYLDGLVGIDDPAAARRCLDQMSRSKRRLRGFNPASPDDARLFAAVLDGKHVISGFRNCDVRQRLLGPDPDNPAEARRRSARITRLLNRLHVHGDIAKVPRTHRWRVTDLGRAAMSAVLEVRDNAFPTAFRKAA